MSFENIFEKTNSRYDLTPEFIWEFSELTYILLHFEQGINLPDLYDANGELLAKAKSHEKCRKQNYFYRWKYYPLLYSKPHWVKSSGDADESRALREEKELKMHEEDYYYGSY